MQIGYLDIFLRLVRRHGQWSIEEDSLQILSSESDAERDYWDGVEELSRPLSAP